MDNSPHIPVLLSVVLEYLRPCMPGIFIDGTFGAGGYTTAILNEHEKNKVIAFDRDKTVLPFVQKVQEKFSTRFSFINDCFDSLATYVETPVNGIVFDVGVSSMQLDIPERGFSFQQNGPLDMRMGNQSLSAAEIVNTHSEKEIADILYQYGQERMSYRIARAICTYRQTHPITTTEELAKIIHSVMPRPKDGKDSAMRSFQALRIAVNDELGQLERALLASMKVLAPNGRLAVVSFHSLEDKVVKDFMTTFGNKKQKTNKYKVSDIKTAAPFTILTPKPILPDETELKLNPRAHSAKFRCAQRSDR